MTVTVAPELATLIDEVIVRGSFDKKRIRHAFSVAAELHGDSMHWTGETVLQHVVGILSVLAPFEPDEDTVIGCLLHHVLEEKVMTLTELEEGFGPKVRSLVSGIHLLSHVTFEGRRRSIDDLRLMVLSVSDDIRILLVALCDRVHCLQFLDNIPDDRAKKLCQDVMHVFAPVSARLGIYSLKHALEGGAFPVLYPNDAERIEEQMRQVHGEFPLFLEGAVEHLQEFLEKQGITATVRAREKLPYSTFRKMNNKSLTHVSDIYDLFAVRVVVDSEEDCYRALGLLHRVGRPVANRFKDYIAFPKPNGYQSLHTTLTAVVPGAEEALVEVQIRTQDMDREATFGIAAHWSYKEQGATSKALEKVQLRSILTGQYSLEDGDDSSFADHIFVLTPRGDIIELPEGATPLDFAFQVHTEMGLSFRGARVNGSIVPLDYELENGDVVEIQKHSNPQPSPQWMQLLKMASSRGKLRRYLAAIDRPRFVTVGRSLINAELKKHHLPPLSTDLNRLKEYEGEQLPHEKREDLLMQVGQGSMRAEQLLDRLGILESVPKQQQQRVPSAELSAADLVAVEGGVSMPVAYAKCCAPGEWPRQDIVGNVTRWGRILVHREDCTMLHNVDPGRKVKAWWR